MPFLEKLILINIYIKRKKETSLSAGTHVGPSTPVQSQRTAKRVFPSSFFGSLTVETAMVLPLFLFALLCFMQFFLVLKVQLQVENGMIQTAKELSQYAYVYEQSDAANHEVLGKVIQGGLSPAYAKSKTTASLKDGGAPDGILAGGTGGISFSNSSFLEDGKTIALCADYEVSFFYNLFSIPDYKVSQAVKVRAWVGRAGKEELDGDGKPVQMVYVTPSGTVYHTSDSCSHIKLSIQQTAYNQIGNLRNQSGGKYYPCERCIGKGDASGQVYITNTGTRYHNSSSCSGLKRDVIPIPITEAGEKRLCSRCGSSF